MKKEDEYIRFEIMGENFTIKSDVPKDYFLELVQKVRGKITDIKQKFPNISNIKAALFAALDFADELQKSSENMIDKDAVKAISELSESLASVMDEE